MEQYKRKIISFFERHQRMPGYKELLTLTGFKSKNAVYKLINKLVAAGVLVKDAAGRIALAHFLTQVPLLGYVEAGLPAVAEQEFLDTLDIDSYLVNNKESSYFLRVKGDSMIEAGIHEGDLVLVERGKQAKLDDIVIAEVDGEYTMKYLRQKKSGNYYLEPANKNYKPIYPTTALNIAAVVKAVIRKY
jgi:repressor LexA